MIDKNKFLKAATFIFFSIEICLFVLICFLKFNGVRELSFLAILICFLFSIFICCKARTSYSKLIMCALFFTVISDIFLVLINNHKLIALITFSFTQLVYMYITLKDAKKIERILNILFRVVLIVGLNILALVVIENYTAFIFVSLFYFSNLFINIIFSGIRAKQNVILFIGLILFGLCDLTIGLSTLSDLAGLSGAFFGFISNPPINLVWLFYLPSQVLIGTSSLAQAISHKKQTSKNKKLVAGRQPS